ncbi:FimV/HubP family polar landmark protein [Rhodoferax sp.]|uniref:type IV pilus assembly protein FimV n=1 Tax=Rhodoferax sp. TaxID=50421 RepID=UPI002624E8C1|nr:FimV/HubP family polar landmark protein [Rhodoferax sp.]MDD2917423.1 fimbrial protein FimV [Rhodoferax sp.]
MIAKSYRRELTAVAFAALLALGGTNAQALSLGRITVQSALGEPLRAEIDIPEINADEAATLNAKIGSPAAFKSSGMEYSSVLPSVRITLQKRSDGRAYLRLSGERLVQEPFVDLILEASWSAGRVVRDYTMLFDPPGLRAPAQPVTVPLTESKAAPMPRSAPRSEPLSAPPAAQPAARQRAADAGAKAAPATARGNGQKVTVRPGETASKIAMAHKLSNVSLDQMLVAMQQTNATAFIEGNVNRIKAGAILALPTAEQARLITPVQASQIITAQSQDFNRFRQTLAGNSALVKQVPAERGISGTIQATVEDKKSAVPTPDKLTLSKGAVQSASDLEKLALARNAEASASQAAQNIKNTEDLNQLAKTAALMAASGAASASEAESTAPNVPASAPQVAVAAPAAQKPASADVAAPPVTVPTPTFGFLDELIAAPLLPAGAAALILLLVGLGFYKVRQRKEKELADNSSFMASGLQAESFFGQSGGQDVDTEESQAPGSAFPSPASQFGEEENVDPLAQADVYLAYGRDVQAEEVLKGALLAQPGHLAIHQKLLAIYAKRQDAKAYAALAALAYPLTQGAGPQWSQICRTGLELEPGNALYLAEAQSASPPGVPPQATLSTVASTVPANVGPGDAARPAGDSVVDLDLDLDFSIDDSASAAAKVPSGMMAFDLDSFSLDLGDGSSDGNEVPSGASANPLESKLALAEEFKASGDDDGARDLIKQVIAEADGAIKAKAQQALSRI